MLRDSSEKQRTFLLVDSVFGKQDVNEALIMESKESLNYMLNETKYVKDSWSTSHVSHKCFIIETHWCHFCLYVCIVCVCMCVWGGGGVGETNRMILNRSTYMILVVKVHPYTCISKLKLSTCISNETVFISIPQPLIA